MSSKVIKICVGIILSIGILVVVFISLDKVNEKDENVITQEEKEVSKIVNSVEIPEIEKELQLESLPNAEAEATKWNDTAKDFIAIYSEYKLDPESIKKEEDKSNDDVTIFSHEFKTSLKISLIYTVDNETKEITEMKLEGYEIARADRTAIFHAMSIFISYIDSDIPVTRANQYLEEIPFSTATEGVYEMEFNGKKYNFVLDLSDGLNRLVYRIGE